MLLQRTVSSGLSHVSDCFPRIIRGNGSVVSNFGYFVSLFVTFFLCLLVSDITHCSPNRLFSDRFRTLADGHRELPRPIGLFK